MFTAINKGFTIITDFGCHLHCPYCISKHHPILAGAKTDISKIDWQHLEHCVAESSSPRVNLSGGGDPFYRYQDHISFYYRVAEITHRYGKLLDIHTRIIPDDDHLLSLFNKLAVSVEHNDIAAITRLAERVSERYLAGGVGIPGSVLEEQFASYNRLFVAGDTGAANQLSNEGVVKTLFIDLNGQIEIAAN